MKIVGKISNCYYGFIADNMIYSFNGSVIKETNLFTLQSENVIKFRNASSIYTKDGFIFIVNTSGKIYAYDMTNKKTVNILYKNAQEGTQIIFSNVNDCCLYSTWSGKLVFFNALGFIKETYLGDMGFNEIVLAIYEYFDKLIVITSQKLKIFYYTNLEEVIYETTIADIEYQISCNEYMWGDYVYFAPCIQGKLIKFDLINCQWIDTDISTAMMGVGINSVACSKFGVSVLDTNGLNVYDSSGASIYHYSCEHGMSLFGNEKYLVAVFNNKSILFSN